MALLSKLSKGLFFESQAEKHLSACGLTSITRNFRIKGGEIDLIMKDNDCIVFVEVRYRKNQHFGHAAETVTYAKQQRLFKAANLWLLQQGLSIHTTNIRFDLVAIHHNGEQVEWIKNAITQG
ncbi:YraN family protein [Vibrio fluminensis]|uniref:YraN family protein n=1 Tax=Vibrio fluminensis TaxID=2783614 RepID=UPI0018886197|nr:YraN family protein [Vibrio fluminensis]